MKKLARLRIIVQELRSLGFYKTEISRLLQIHHSTISRVTSGDPDWPDARKDRRGKVSARAVALMRTRPDDFLTLADLASACGTSSSSLKVLLWRWEETNFRDLKRGFAVPKTLQKEFSRLRRKRLTIREAGEALGLLGRGEGAMTAGEAIKSREKVAPNRNSADLGGSPGV